MSALGQAGVIPVVPPAQLEQQLQQQAAQKAANMQPSQGANPGQDPTTLIGYVRGQFEIFRNHRNTGNGWSERLLIALRTFNGQYDASKLQQIKQFGGSEIYARIAAQKCRAASSLLRDIYLGPDRPWGLKPPDDPDIPDEVQKQILQVVASEAQMLKQAGQAPNPMDLRQRHQALLESAADASKKCAKKQTSIAEDKVEEIYRNGGYYHALAEFLVDLPIFPFACIKGPIVRVIPQVKWPPGGGRPNVQMVPKLTWTRVSPFDLWWTPGVSDIENANIIEKSQITRAELNELLDLPGYNTAEIYAVLDEYGRGGLYDNWDTTDAERAVLESRENPAFNRSALISMMEFNGNVQGRVLQDYGLMVQDELRDYHVQVWCIGNHVIKAHLSPSPRMRHPYFITSFEKVPGTPIGNGLVDLLQDIQEASNATLRALVNNLSIASGPQVVVNDDAIMPQENSEQLYPWKRWHARRDPLAGAGSDTKKPVEFFQPDDNSEKLIKVIEFLNGLADDVSAIPKYVGGSASGGAGRTASGLAMLMGNASKILQTVSANVDRDVIEPSTLQLVDLILLTDTSGMLTGEEQVTVQGVSVAIQRETQRQRQIEFLQTTNNPTDLKITGLKGRAEILRSVATTIGMSGDDIVPSEDALEKMEKQGAEQHQEQELDAKVQEGIAAGVKAGVQRISTELTSGFLAARAQLPEGPAVHIGTEPASQAPPPGATPAQGVPGTGGSQHAEGAAQAQGSQPSQLSTKTMGPQTAVTGNQPKGGPGSSGRMIQGGAG